MYCDPTGFLKDFYIGETGTSIGKRHYTRLEAIRRKERKDLSRFYQFRNYCKFTIFPVGFIQSWDPSEKPSPLQLNYLEKIRRAAERAALKLSNSRKALKVQSRGTEFLSKPILNTSGFETGYKRNSPGNSQNGPEKIANNTVMAAKRINDLEDASPELKKLKYIDMRELAVITEEEHLFLAKIPKYRLQKIVEVAENLGMKNIRDRLSKYIEKETVDVKLPCGEQLLLKVMKQRVPILERLAQLRVDRPKPVSAATVLKTPNKKVHEQWRKDKLVCSCKEILTMRPDLRCAGGTDGEPHVLTDTHEWAKKHGAILNQSGTNKLRALAEENDAKQAEWNAKARLSSSQKEVEVYIENFQNTIVQKTKVKRWLNPAEIKEIATRIREEPGMAKYPGSEDLRLDLKWVSSSSYCQEIDKHSAEVSMVCPMLMRSCMASQAKSSYEVCRQKNVWQHNILGKRVQKMKTSQLKGLINGKQLEGYKDFFTKIKGHNVRRHKACGHSWPFIRFAIKKKFLDRIDKWREANRVAPPPGLGEVESEGFMVPFPLMDEDGILVEKIGFRPITPYSSHIEKTPLRIKSRVLRYPLHEEAPGLNLKDSSDLIDRLNKIRGKLASIRKKEFEEGKKLYAKAIFSTADISSHFTQASMATAFKTMKETIRHTDSDGWSTNMKGRIMKEIINRKQGIRVGKYQTKLRQGTGYGRYRGTWESILQAFQKDIADQYSKAGPFLLRQKVGTAMGSPLGPVAADFFSAPYDIGIKRKYEKLWEGKFNHTEIMLNTKYIDDKIGILGITAESELELEKRVRGAEQIFKATYFRSDSYPGCTLNVESFGETTESLGFGITTDEEGFVVSKIRTQRGASFQSGLGFATRAEKRGRLYGQIYRAVMGATFQSRKKYLFGTIAEVADDFRITGYSESLIADALLRLKRRIGFGDLFKRVAF